jgi:hypothetical protein
MKKAVSCTILMISLTAPIFGSEMEYGKLAEDANPSNLRAYLAGPSFKEASYESLADEDEVVSHPKSRFQRYLECIVKLFTRSN